MTRRALILAAFVALVCVAGFFSAAKISTSENQPPKKNNVIRNPFRPEHPTREQTEREASAPAGAENEKQER